ncbi:MAG: OPT family oligopeptide transporter [Syntrophobacteraceae bacterium]
MDTSGKSPSEIEMEWFENVYRGDVPQLTARAVVIGSLLGAVMSLSNLFVGLKTGWGLGIAITACILSFTIGAGLKRIGLLGSNLSILENNCMQSTASSAGYSTGSTIVSAISALLLIQGHHIPFWTLMSWTVLLAVLGVFLAIPMKRQMINIEQLPFPSGLAAAETLRSLYAKGEAASRKARGLGIASGLGGLVAFVRDNRLTWWPGFMKLPEMVNFPGALAGRDLASWTISFEMSAIMIAAGAIIGMKVAWSMLAGGVLNYALIAPHIYEKGIIQELGYKNIVSWSLWGGTALMVSSGLLTFAFQWKTVWRALAGTGRMLRGEHRGGDAAPTGGNAAPTGGDAVPTSGNAAPTGGDAVPTSGNAAPTGGDAAPMGAGRGSGDEKLRRMEAIEVPGSWFSLGVIVSGAGIVTVQVVSFSIDWWMGAVSVFMTFFLAVVACRATGETDITPIGAMGKITQLTYGIIAPTNITANLMTAGVTAGAAASAADLLTDLKSGYLLGANPRKQFIAQFLGVFAGAAAIVPAFYLLAPSPEALGGERFPAPGAQVWKGVAELLANGLASLHPSAQLALALGAGAGIALATLDRFAPARVRVFLPSAMGLGLAFVVPFWNTLSIFIGATAAYLARKTPAGPYTIPVASGIIAGESLIGVLMALSSAIGP